VLSAVSGAILQEPSCPRMGPTGKPTLNDINTLNPVYMGDINSIERLPIPYFRGDLRGNSESESDASISDRVDEFEPQAATV